MHIKRLLHKYLLCKFNISEARTSEKNRKKLFTDTFLVPQQIEPTCSYFATVLHRASFELLILMEGTIFNYAH